MAPQKADAKAAPARVGAAAQTLLRWREVLRFAAAPSDAHLTEPSDVFMIFERDQISFQDPQGKPVHELDLTGATADLVLLDECCYDLKLTMPPAPLPEFEAMISNEISFASPFREEDAHAFWRANETAAGDWDVHVGVVLKSEVARARRAAREQGVILRRIVRLGPTEASSIYAAPDWLTDAPEATPKFPAALQLPALAMGLFVLSVAGHMAFTALQASDLRNRADAADLELRRAAGEMGFQRSVETSVAKARQNIQSLAQLSARLPDDTWLDRITLEGDTIRVVGFGPSGAETVRLLSDFEGVQDPRSIGTVTRDNTQNVERFVIEFDFVRPTP